MKTNRARLCILALSFSFFALGAAFAQCRPGDVLIGEDANKYICMERNRYQRSNAPKFGSDYCRAKQAVQADQAAIAALGFALDSERFEVYGDVAAEQKAQLQHRILSALFDQGLSATQVIVRSASSLNPWNVNRAVRALEENGFDNPVVVSALRFIAEQRDKPAMAAAYADFVNKLKGAKQSWETRTDMATDRKNAHLRLAVGALKIMQGNPELGLIITGLNFGENITYLVYLTNRIDALNDTTDGHLARLHDLSERLKGHVAAMSAAKRGWRSATEYDRATPLCRP